MDNMENFRERFGALEHRTAGLAGRVRWSACLLAAALVVYALAPTRRGQAADFGCTAGDVTCLITAINTANANGEANTITLEAGTYTLTAVDNNTDGPNGLPSVTSVLSIKGTRAATTILERDTSARGFRILKVTATGTLTLQRLTLRNGGAPSGGGINNSGTLTLIDCILTRNSGDPGGGLFNLKGTVTITHTTFDGNASAHGGGGLINGFTEEGGTVTIANSTFVHNIADNGGGLTNGTGTITLTNTTVAQNVGVNLGGGGISNGGIVLLQSTTVAENQAPSSFFGDAGGIANNGIVLLQNTIIARNEARGRPADCSGPVTSLGNNLLGTGCTLQPSDLTGDPGLGTFIDNGRPGNGHFPLLSTSQAIDAGNNAVCLRRDQLGKRRVGPCDIGAIAFRDKDDRQHEEEDDQQHQEDLVGAVQGSR